jgi:hypothetical protein
MGPVKHSVYWSATDILDEGAPVMLDNVARLTGTHRRRSPR